MTDKRLGRGLDYLLNISSNQDLGDHRVKELNIKTIRKNRFQPRDTWNEEGLKELQHSIRENGLLQPILVRKDGEQYELIAGERRLKAFTALGKTTIPAIVMDLPDNKMLQVALIENIQRENLTAIEEARAYQDMIQLEGLTQEELSKRVGKNRSTVANTLRLLELPVEIQEGVSRGTISQGHARALLSLDSKENMLEAFKKVILDDLSVRELEQYVREIKNPPKKQIRKTNSKTPKDPNIISHEEALVERLGTKVDINLKGDKGKIEIHFFSFDDFDRLFKVLNNDTN